jgi:hypothetical protein
MLEAMIDRCPREFDLEATLGASFAVPARLAMVHGKHEPMVKQALRERPMGELFVLKSEATPPCFRWATPFPQSDESTMTARLGCPAMRASLQDGYLLQTLWSTLVVIAVWCEGVPVE